MVQAESDCGENFCVGESVREIEFLSADFEVELEVDEVSVGYGSDLEND